MTHFDVRPDHAADLRRLLAEPRDVCSRLGLNEAAIAQGGGGLLIRCPWHADRTPSCSVRRGADGTIAIRCHGCGATGDVLHLIAVANDLDARSDFPAVLAKAAELAGTTLDAVVPLPKRPKAAPIAAVSRAPQYPPARELSALWSACVPVLDDAGVSAWLDKRLGKGAADKVELFGLARALPVGATLPPWARFRGRTWAETSHRCLFAMFDGGGVMRSVRARRVVDGETPKSLPPGGYECAQLVFADALGRIVLTEGRRPNIWPTREPLKIWITEGETDFCAVGIDRSDADATAPGVLSVVSGAWTEEIAGRIPDGTEVVIATDHDDAGNRYADAIVKTLADRCRLYRLGEL